LSLSAGALEKIDLPKATSTNPFETSRDIGLAGVYKDIDEIEL